MQLMELIEEFLLELNSVKLLNAKDKKDIEIFTNDEIKKLISYKRPSIQKENKYLAIRDDLIINFF